MAREIRRWRLWTCWGLPAVVALLSLVGASPARASTLDQATAYQLDAAHDGYMTGAPLTAPLSRLWSVTPGGTLSYPLIADGVIYVTAGPPREPTMLYAISEATGTALWSAPAGAQGITYDAGRIFTLRSDGTLIAYDAASGATDWSVELQGQYDFSSPPTAINGIVYTAGSGGSGTVYAVRESDGKTLWTQPVENGDDSSPAVVGGNVYVTYVCQQDYAFDGLNGNVLWHVAGSCEGGGGLTPVVSEGYVFSRNLYRNTIIPGTGLLLSTTDGSTAGTFVGNGPAPAVGGGTAYLPNGSSVTAVTASGLGANLWTFEADSQISTAPLLVGGLVFIGSESGKVYALDSKGNAVWSSNVGETIPAYDENIALPPSGLAAGEGLLVVPAGETLVAYAPTGSLTGTPTVQATPHIDGTVRAGSPTAVDIGVWTGVPTEYAYQWQSCDGVGANCSDVSGATSSVYTPGEESTGSTLRVDVTAKNANGSTEALSEPSATVITPTPINKVPPTISGNVWLGWTLTASPGIWSGNPSSFVYQWYRCPFYTCSPISGAVSNTYTPTTEDTGSPIEVRVTPIDAGGASPPASSTQTLAVTPPEPPRNTSAPTIAGTPQYPGTLTASPGAWSGYPTSFEYQWFDCSATSGCSVIVGATSPTYELTPFDAGERIAVGVIAKNITGASNQAYSGGTSTVTTLASGIVGRVTNAATGTPIQGIEVCAYDQADGGLFGECTTTSSRGEYVLTELASGGYEVEFSSPTNSALNYVTQYYDEKALPSEAESVSVTPDNITSGIDARLKEESRISGEVTSQSTKAAIEGVVVCAFTTSDKVRACAATNANGEYTISDLPQGDYEVGFDGTEAGYAIQYYDGQSSLSAATPVAVGSGKTSPGINAQLVESGRIAGTVTNASTSTAIEDVLVCAFTTSNEIEECATTNAGGEYIIAGLPSGEYKVGFNDGKAYVVQYYNDESSLSAAQSLPVAAGSSYGDINARMQSSGAGPPAHSPSPVPPPPAGSTNTGQSGDGQSVDGSGRTDNSGVLASTETSIDKTQIAACSGQQLTPAGKAAKLATLLKVSGFTAAFNALEAGTAIIDWYHPLPSARAAKKTRSKLVTVASGRTTFSAPGARKIRIKLTAAGIRLLKDTKSPKLTAKCTFIPTGKAAVTVSKAFVLK